MSELESNAIEDAQNLVNVIWEVTAFFYRKCISLDNETFYDSVVELATKMLFESN